jgi:hypothetical protein
MVGEVVYNVILFSHKKEGSLPLYDNMASICNK